MAVTTTTGKLPWHVYFKENFKKFVLETSLAGLKYIAEVNRSIWERAYYFISFTIVFTCGLYMVLYFLHKWDSTPIIITFSSKTVSIEDVPFPAITFCNMNQVSASSVKDIQPDTVEYAMLQAMCFKKYNYSRFKNFKPRLEGDSFVNFALKHSQKCSDMLVYCKYGGLEEPCTNLFREIFVDEGICCVFNRLHPFFIYKASLFYTLLRDYTQFNGRTSIPVNWNLETGYEKPLPLSYYPKKGAGMGVSLGLTVVLNVSIDDYYCSTTNGPGFKVHVTNPIDIINIKEIGLPIMVGHQSRLRLLTKSITSDPLLHNIKPKDRHCYFMAEKKLLSFRHYVKRYCEAECNAKYVLDSCNCVPREMPQLYANATECFLSEIDCVNHAKRTMQNPKNLKCKEECLPGCYQLRYFPDLYVTPLTTKRFHAQNNVFNNISLQTIKKDLAMVEIYYKRTHFRPTTNLPYTGLTEFLSQSGGIMGLMVGFSVVSIAELFYFVLMKPFVDMILKRSPFIVDSHDHNEIQREMTTPEPFHHELMFKRRRNMHERVVNWEKTQLQVHDHNKY